MEDYIISQLSQQESAECHSDYEHYLREADKEIPPMDFALFVYYGHWYFKTMVNSIISSLSKQEMKECLRAYGCLPADKRTTTHDWFEFVISFYDQLEEDKQQELVASLEADRLAEQHDLPIKGRGAHRCHLQITH
jgi:hypothetical protein